MNNLMEYTEFCLNYPSCVDIPITIGFDFGSALENVYPLLQIIFDYLDAADLQSCSEVKHTWREVAEDILRRRAKPSWFSCYQDDSDDSYSLLKSTHFPTSSASVGMVLVGNNYMKYLRSGEKEILETILKNLRRRAMEYCVILCSEVLPLIKPEIEIGKDIMDGLFLPVLPNIRTTMFHYPGKNVVSYKDVGKLKCLLIFMSEERSSKLRKKTVKRLLEKYVPKCNERVAVGGGVISGIKTPEALEMERYSNVALTIAFWQLEEHAQFDAFSCVIKRMNYPRRIFCDKLVEFKKNIKLRKYSVAIRICSKGFIFSEVGDYDHDYDEYNNDDYETIHFKEVFRDVPLFGCHSESGIGLNTFPGHTQQYPDYLEPFNESSTVFVVLTWGDIL